MDNAHLLLGLCRIAHLKRRAAKGWRGILQRLPDRTCKRRHLLLQGLDGVPVFKIPPGAVAPCRLVKIGRPGDLRV